MSGRRIQQTFENLRREGRTGLAMFLTVGFPDKEATIELVPALIRAGADIVELGVPFSDPLGEGPVIQESSFKAQLQKPIFGNISQLWDHFETTFWSRFGLR